MRIWSWAPVAAVLTTLACSLPAAAQDRDPDWVRKPRPEDLLTVWPRAAWEQGLGGKAVITCTVTTEGALRECQVVEEDPKGFGFGTAAIALTAQLSMRPKLVGGKAVPSSVRLPFTFSDPGAPTGTRTTRGDGIAAPPPRMVSNVSWRQAPTYAQVVAAFPEELRSAGVDARAALECTIHRDGSLRGCRTIAEEPKGKGVAQAARQLAPLFLAPEIGPDGQPLAGARVHVPLTFGKAMPTSPAPVIGKPTWTSLPSGDDVAASFPAAARAAGVTAGRIRLRCQIGDAGRLNTCEVLSEEPASLGFGEAGKALASSFQMSLWTAEGLPTQGGHVIIPLRYEAPKDQAAATGTP